MAIISISWDNSDVAASPNVTAQIASRRIKAVGGPWDIAGFTPANDMLKTVSAATATVTENRVYEFKVEAVCSSGIIPNTNGIREGIIFACVNPSFTATQNSVTVSYPLTGLDITKVRVTLKRQSDSSTVLVVTSPVSGGTGFATFSSLTPATGYFAQMEMAALVNGVEVWSSAVKWLGALCGSNVPGFQVSTSAAAAFNPVFGGFGASASAACTNNTVYYVAAPFLDIANGVTVYADPAGTIPAIGHDFIRSGAGQIYDMNSATALVGALSVSQCTGTINITNQLATGQITNVTPPFYGVGVGSLPVGPGQTTSGSHAGFSGIITVVIDGTSGSAFLRINGGSFTTCINVTGNGTFNSPVGTIGAVGLSITLSSTPC